MELNQLLEFICDQEGRLKAFFVYANQRELILANLVKLNEEVGELCAEALAECGLVRKEKKSAHSMESAENELADVLITTLLLAKSMDLDVKRALETKIEKIKTRLGGV